MDSIIPIAIMIHYGPWKLNISVTIFVMTVKPVIRIKQTKHQLIAKTTGKLQDLPEISWLVWVLFQCFWLVLCCFVWMLFIMNKEIPFMVYLSKKKTFVVNPSKKQLGSTPPWIWRSATHMLLIWSIYIAVWPKFLHSSSLGERKFCWSLEFCGNGLSRSNQASPHKVNSNPES